MLTRLLIILTTVLVLGSTFAFAQAGDLAAGQRVEVLTPLWHRSEPGLSGQRIDVLEAGTLGTILEAAPVFVDGFWWWEVLFDDGSRGWSAQGEDEERYLAPVLAVAQADESGTARQEAEGGVPTATASEPANRHIAMDASQTFASASGVKLQQVGSLGANSAWTFAFDHSSTRVATWAYTTKGHEIQIRLLPELALDATYPLHGLREVGGLEEVRLAWSPDGKQLAYCYTFSQFSGPQRHIGIVDLETGRDLRLPVSYPCREDFVSRDVVMFWHDSLGPSFARGPVYQTTHFSVSSLNLDTLTFEETVSLDVRDIGEAAFVQQVAEYVPGFDGLGNVFIRRWHEFKESWPYAGPLARVSDRLVVANRDLSYVRPIEQVKRDAIVHFSPNRQYVAAVLYPEGNTVVYQISPGGGAPLARVTAEFSSLAAPSQEIIDLLEQYVNSGGIVYARSFTATVNPLNGRVIAPDARTPMIVRLISIEDGLMTAEVAWDEGQVPSSGYVLSEFAAPSWSQLKDMGARYTAFSAAGFLVHDWYSGKLAWAEVR